MVKEFKKLRTKVSGNVLHILMARSNDNYFKGEKVENNLKNLDGNQARKREFKCLYDNVRSIICIEKRMEFGPTLYSM